MEKLIEEKFQEMARSHAHILENECEKVCKEYEVQPKDLIIEYLSKSEVKIIIQGAALVINHAFIIKGKDINEAI